jgi:quercetin 2,3-dioxygenase
LRGRGCLNDSGGGNRMIMVRDPQSIYQIESKIVYGRFKGRWHFVFGDYYDPQFEDFGTLRVFNDSTLTPGAAWPLHQHRNHEIVTYVADGELICKDEHGKGGVLMKGWVQHTTAGCGIWQAEINNRLDRPMRIIQMWFYPLEHDFKPFVEQKVAVRADRTDRFLPLVSNQDAESLFIVSDARVFSGFLQSGKTAYYNLEAGRGIYLYLLEGGPISVNGTIVPTLGAAMITAETAISVSPEQDAELLLVDVKK